MTEPQRNSTSDTDSMRSGRAPMPMHLLQPRMPPLPEVKIPEYKIPEPRPLQYMRMPEPPVVSQSAPPPPVSAPPPAPVAQSIPQAPPIVVQPIVVPSMNIPPDVLRGAFPSTAPSDAERRVSTPDTTSTMTGISMDNLSSFPRPDREPVNQLHAIPEGNSVRSGSMTPTVPENILDSTPGHAVEEWRRSTSTVQQESPHIPLSHAQSNRSLHQPTMLQTPQQLSASSSRETLSPNDGQLRRTSSRSTHSIDIEVEPPSRPQSASDHPNDRGNMELLSPNHTPTILPPEPPEHRPVVPTIPMDNGPGTSHSNPPGFMSYPSVVVSGPDDSPETPKMVPSAGWGMNDWGKPPSAAGSPWGGSTSALPAATTSADPDPQQASGFGAPRTPRAAYEIASTPPGFTYPLPPGRTPSNPAVNYPLPASSGKGSSRASSSSSSSSSSTTSSRSGSRSHRSRRSAGSTPVQSFVLPPVSLVGGAAMSPGASPPDPTTYMNTLANSATATPRMGMGRSMASPLVGGQSPYMGSASLYRS
ncbi:uncharacterized protein EV420DRAFT_366629 [Desarmillaria tabescens]|uniref:Uncharacterized protein n=1 Tax=Armillaria tabescens TaxID=1929756 RepID=A0AA39N5W3_ARMTA|nr:uncharacterized protein EV420DRAFT_366629 [Desarmillaria tabescens]KAK0458584.1 hypothetical protein EV420DRAFT_366629 [Desarmillaria tabescens]